MESQNPLQLCSQSGHQQTSSTLKERESSLKSLNDNKDDKSLKAENKEEENMMSTLETYIVTEKSNGKWKDIVVLEQVKKSLEEAIIDPFKSPNKLEGEKTSLKNVLLYGPPGTGKTYLAKACAIEANVTLFYINAVEIISTGECDKLIKTLFKMARMKKPAIIFIDEIDLFLSKSDNESHRSRRARTEFFIQTQVHDNKGILLLTATNSPRTLCPVTMKIFQDRIYIPLPDDITRLALIKQELNKIFTTFTEEEVQHLAKKTEGYSCADIHCLIRDASYRPLRKIQNATHFKVISMSPSGQPMYVACAPSDEQGQVMKLFDIPGDQLSLAPVTMDDFEASLLAVKPSINKIDIEKYEEFMKNLNVKE